MTRRLVWHLDNLAAYWLCRLAERSLRGAK